MLIYCVLVVVLSLVCNYLVCVCSFPFFFFSVDSGGELMHVFILATYSLTRDNHFVASLIVSSFILLSLFSFLLFSFFCLTPVFFYTLTPLLLQFRFFFSSAFSFLYCFTFSLLFSFTLRSLISFLKTYFVSFIFLHLLPILHFLQYLYSTKFKNI